MEPIPSLVNLACGLLVAWLVINHYRNKIPYAAERYSTFWPRFWSPSIDAIILWPITGLLPLIAFHVLPSSMDILNIFTTLAYYAYSIYFHGTRGGTIGKLKCKIKVVTAKGEGSIGIKEAFLRDAVPLFLCLGLYGYFSFIEPETSGELGNANYVSLVFLGWFLAEIVTMLTNKKRRALHDYIAGTVVVRFDGSEAPENPASVGVLPPHPPLPGN